MMDISRFWRRAAALLLDALLLGIAFLYFYHYTNFSDLTVNKFAFQMAIWGFIPTALSILFVTIFNATPGKLILGIKIIKQDGRKIRFGDALIRTSIHFSYTYFLSIVIWLSFDADTICAYVNLPSINRASFFNEIIPFWSRIVLHIIAAIAVIDYLIVFTNKKRQTLHDTLAGTLVIRRERQLQATKA